MSEKITDDARKIFSWGKSLTEIEYDPHFQKVMEMFNTVIRSLESSVCSDAPEDVHDLDYRTVLVHRAGRVKGMKDFVTLMQEYRNFFKKNSGKEGYDE